jgi:hypothetical protein
MVRANNEIADGQTQASACANFFGGEKWLKYFLARLRAHADAVVDNADNTLVI